MSIAFIILILTSSSGSAQGICYVRPNSSSQDCPGEPCLDLHQYVIEQAAEYFTSGSTFIFLPGNHTLQTAANLSSVSNITLKGEQDAMVILSNQIFCENITNLVIFHMKFLLVFNTNSMTAWTIVQSADIIINCSIFEGNLDLKNSGKALLLGGSNVSVSNSLFRWNTEGTIVSYNSIAILSKNTFTGNRAYVKGGSIDTGDGGAIFALLSTIILNCNIFTRNSANGSGGAINSVMSTLVMNGNLFEGNKAVFRGGAIFASDSNIDINGARQIYFKSNAAQEGGAVYLEESCFMINNSNSSIKFAANSAKYNGGAMFSSNSRILSEVGELTFHDNSARKYGGALKVIADFREQENSNVAIISANFINNRAGICGGAGDIAVNGIIFRNTMAKGNSDSAFCISGDLSFIGGTNFSRNTGELGGALYIHPESQLSFTGHTVFDGNIANSGGAIYAMNGVKLAFFTSISFSRNMAQADGGAISVSSNSWILSEVGELTFFNNSAGNYGGALKIIADFQEQEDSNEAIISAKFINNRAGICGGAGDIAGKGIFRNTIAKGNSNSAFCISGNFSFIGYTNFSRNTGKLGGAIYIHPESYVSFTGHSMFDGNIANSGGAIYALNGVNLAFNTNIYFSHNMARADGGVIYARFRANVTFHLSATINIHYNSAQNGGAIYLNGGALLMFMEKVELIASHNHASEYGGVIYYEDVPTTTQCKYKRHNAVSQLPYCSISFAMYKSFFGQTNINCLVKSYNDSSGIDGSFMYGGLLDRCQIDAKHWLPNQDRAVVPFEIILRDLQVELFDGVRTITSQPYQLCFCSKHSYCTGTLMNIKTYRGQTFAVSLMALDQVKISTSTQIKAKVFGISGLKSKESHQILSPNCSELKYTLYSTDDSEELILYPDGPCHETGLAKVVVNVTLLPCPPGFRNTNEECICEKRLQIYGANCTINKDISITRGPDSSLWMRALYDNTTYQGLILYHTCPVEYCTMGAVPVDLDNPDMQCANNRSGMLCGACATNYSLMLGSSRCEECSNTYLALLFPFAAAGIALVVFLSILRLTVATGMINSVILYANIVQAKRGIFFPSNTVNVLTVFIAWMNLDFGFETCFYNGLTAYAETWLQFSFPIYIWMLILVIILASKYSLTVSKWIGHNPIAVLATLLLMSYTKILKIIIDVYRSANLDYPEGKEDTRWLKDANVDYLHTKHLALSVVTALVFVFIFLPYTLLLLFGYKLYHFSERKAFHWLNRLKPLLDSYYAPYNKHTRYWTGFLLLVRCALYGTFSFGETRSLLAICVTFTLILAYECLLPGKVYGKSYNNILEIAMFTNLTILATATSADVSSPALMYSLIGIVFSIMMAIIFCQFYSIYIAESAVATKLRSMRLRRTQKVRVTEQAPENKAKAISSTTIELREPLLDD